MPIAYHLAVVRAVNNAVAVEVAVGPSEALTPVGYNDIQVIVVDVAIAIDVARQGRDNITSIEVRVNHCFNEILLKWDRPKED